MNEDIKENEEIPEGVEEIPEVDLSSFEGIPQSADYTEHFNDIITHLDTIQRVQSNFYNDIIDISVFAVAVVIGLFAFKEFMDRATRW